MSNYTFIFSVRTWVVQVRGRYKGRVGRIIRRTRGLQFGFRERYEVQFGAGGPFEWLSVKSLRRAAVDEIPEGVG